MNTFKNRRQFLMVLGSAAAAGIAYPLIFHREHSEFPEHLLKYGFAVSGLGPKERADKELGNYFASPRSSNGGSILVGNMAGTQLKEIPTSFVCHQVIQNPHKLNQLFGIQKWGANAVAVDLHSEKVTALSLPAGFYFFGHAAYINNGTQILISAMDQNKVQGLLLKYDTQSLQLVGQIPTFGLNPHEVQVSQDQKHLIVVNMGQPEKEREQRVPPPGTPNASCLSRIDIESGQLLSQIDLSKENYGYSHFLNINDAEILCMGLSYTSYQKLTPPAVAYVSPGQVLDLEPDPMFHSRGGEALSACRLGDQLLISLPESNAVVLFDIVTRKVLKAFYANSPRGVILTPQSDFAFITQSDQRDFFMAYSVKEQRLMSLQESQAPRGPRSSEWKAMGAHFTQIIWPF